MTPLLAVASISGPGLALWLLLPGCAGLSVLGLIWGARRVRSPRCAPAVEHPAYAAMDKLCADGWEATILVSSRTRTARAIAAPETIDALGPMNAGTPVEIRWRRFSDPLDGSKVVAVERSLAAPDVAAALWRMVDDCNADLVLEEIETGCLRPGVGRW